MKYEGEKNYKHGSKERLGVLITNLGTPDQPNKKALKLENKYYIYSPPPFPRHFRPLYVFFLSENVRK